MESRGAKVAPSGFSIDPIEYHRKLYTQLPELYAGENYARNFDYEGHFSGRGVFAVDAVWVEHFPQYQPFLGEKLALYLIGGGSQAVAVPESVYPRGGGVLSAAEQAMQGSSRVSIHIPASIARQNGFFKRDTAKVRLWGTPAQRRAGAAVAILRQIVYTIGTTLQGKERDT